MTNRTAAYRFTVQMKDGKPVAEQAHLVESLRKSISAENTWRGVKQYVKLQGRGPRAGKRSYNQSLPLPLAMYADVYVYIR
jgi:hypothetical protein